MAGFNNNKYDTDVTIFSPAGRLLQVEYAQKAVEQGTPVVGLRSSKHVVLAAFQKANSDLAQHQQKIFKIDNHMAIGISGLTADARVLAEYMRNECLNNRYIYDSPMMAGRLVSQVADISQQRTQFMGRRPYGVGTLLASVDDTGPHIFETCPTGNYYEYFAMAIGGRSTSAKTYLEKHFNSFPDCSEEALIQHAVEAVNKTTAAETTLSVKNTCVIVIGPDQKYKEVSTDELQKCLDKLEKKETEPDAMDTSGS